MTGFAMVDKPEHVLCAFLIDDRFRPVAASLMPFHARAPRSDPFVRARRWLPGRRIRGPIRVTVRCIAASRQLARAGGRWRAPSSRLLLRG